MSERADKVRVLDCIIEATRRRVEAARTVVAPCYVSADYIAVKAFGGDPEPGGLSMAERHRAKRYALDLVNDGVLCRHAWDQHSFELAPGLRGAIEAEVTLGHQGDRAKVLDYMVGLAKRQIAHARHAGRQAGANVSKVSDAVLALEALSCDRVPDRVSHVDPADAARARYAALGLVCEGKLVEADATGRLFALPQPIIDEIATHAVEGA